jgi:hypothetical protein
MFHTSSPAAVLACCLLLGAAACSFSQGDERGAANALPILLEQDRHHARRVDGRIEFELRLSLANPTDGPIYLTTCRGPHPPLLEKHEAGEWVPVYQPPALMCLGPPERIGPGETYDYTYRISAELDDGGSHPQWHTTEVDGSYRVRWHAYTGWTEAGPPQDAGPREALSPVFELRVGD